jgi:hypothetical protein
MKISGLGTAGASGLLALLFPSSFGTVDQFVVKSLLKVRRLAERDLLSAMTPEALTIVDGVVLIKIMRRKAAELRAAFGSDFWTPRKIDQVLWASDRN